MAEPKPFASLSSGLLARKGGAKPAMRPQGFGSFGSSLEDLGWNDMGQAPEEHVPTPVHALTPSPVPREAPEPAVVEQQRQLETSFAPSEPSAVVSLPQRRAASAAVPAKTKAAFTLRLESERHLRLRLACALTRRSAQQLVTEALDQFLNSLPEVEALAGHVPAEAGQRSR